jgi:diguanylate cyclase (GGDEF)-like protein
LNTVKTNFSISATIMLCSLLLPSIVQSKTTQLEEVLQLIKASKHIDLDVLGPKMEETLNQETSPEKKAKQLILLINIYFSDGFQDKFINYAKQLKQHSMKYQLKEDAFIAELFLLPDQLDIQFRSQAFFEKLNSLKNNLDDSYSERALYQIDIMLTILTPSSFKFSQEQVLMNHLAKIKESGTQSKYQFFFYKALSTSHSQIDLMLEYSKKMLEFALENNMPVNRDVLLHNLGYSYHFRRMTAKSRQCIDLQLELAFESGDAQKIFFAQARELEQYDQEQNYSAMLELVDRIKSSDYKPSEFWQNFVDYYQAVAFAYTGQVEQAEATYQRIYDFLNKPELARHALSKYLNAHILFNQQKYIESKHEFNDYWWHRYNQVLQQQEQHIDEIRAQFQVLVDEKNESISLAEYRLKQFKWISALLLLSTLVIAFLVIRTKRDAKVLTAQHKKMKILSRTDDLTQLFNRRYIQKRLYEEFELYLRNPQTKASLLMIDLDHFKSINDTYGHATGDLVLEIVARIIDERSRKTDLFARYGGEEFLLLLRNTDADNALKLAEKIRTAIESKAIEFKGKTIHITCSIGISAFNEHLETCHDWIQQADMAMYQSKQNGRNQTTVYSTESK